jgi:hypothetical protein
MQVDIRPVDVSNWSFNARRVAGDFASRFGVEAYRRPLTLGELARLREEFTVSFTYNSNAIKGNTLTLQETALVLEGITIDRKPLKDHLEADGGPFPCL